MSKIIMSCDFCGKPVSRYGSKVKKHNFCSRECLSKFSSSKTNPDRYAQLKNYTRMSENMKRLNEKLNPHRMDFQTRIKLRQSRLGKGAGKTYAKFLSHPEHRISAELAIGRKLLPGEVVHHIDGNKRNNEATNLMVFPSQAEHAAWHKQHNMKEGDAR